MRAIVSTTVGKRTRRRVPTCGRRRGALRRSSLYRSGAVILIPVNRTNKPLPPSSVRGRPLPVYNLRVEIFMIA